MQTVTQHKYRQPGAPDALYLLTADELVEEAELERFTPRSAQEALHSPLKDRWHEAMCREKLCHEKNCTFGAVNPNAKQPVPVGWVFKIKYRGPPVNLSSLHPKQFKARVVIRGQYMKEGLHFNDTFAPVAKQTSVRLLIAYATKYNCHLKTGTSRQRS